LALPSHREIIVVVFFNTTETMTSYVRIYTSQKTNSSLIQTLHKSIAQALKHNTNTLLVVQNADIGYNGQNGTAAVVDVVKAASPKDATAVGQACASTLAAKLKIPAESIFLTVDKEDVKKNPTVPQKIASPATVEKLESPGGSAVKRKAEEAEDKHQTPKKKKKTKNTIPSLELENKRHSVEGGEVKRQSPLKRTGTMIATKAEADKFLKKEQKVKLEKERTSNKKAKTKKAPRAKKAKQTPSKKAASSLSSTPVRSKDRSVRSYVEKKYSDYVV